MNISALNHFGLIRVSGTDALTFLQGQFGNDVNALQDHNQQLNCYSNPKGRLLAIFRLFRFENSYYLRMPREIIDATLQRLKMFVLMSKVVLEDASEAFIGLGLSGNGATATVAEQLGAAPTVNGTLANAKMIALCINDSPARYELYIKSAIEHSLTPNASSDHWRYQDILAGLPSIYTASCEVFVAQMVNLQLIHGLSFKKGCYPGQEIVARMHYLGKLKRRMYLVTIHGETPPPINSPIYQQDQTVRVGEVVDACQIEEQAMRALVVLKIDQAENNDLIMVDSNDAVLQIDTLPYSFNPDD